ncbi:MAG TPA: hypothetical protein VK501_04540 [Baekduia sp.]|uniref:hypothetical protein n=1 Tax=Baekduia sp. TaxID=2600305 RepID=UPI002C23D1A3|nr:hypothetical protein [Baekduia sp.]HMJ33166.1 hypothetical protein [Baekduia sp.]
MQLRTRMEADRRALDLFERRQIGVGVAVLHSEARVGSYDGIQFTLLVTDGQAIRIRHAMVGVPRAEIVDLELVEAIERRFMKWAGAVAREERVRIVLRGDRFLEFPELWFSEGAEAA